MKFNIPKDELVFEFSKSRGPGGQSVNKTNSKASLKWNVENSIIWSIDPDAKSRFKEKFKNKINKNNELFLNSDEFRNQKDNIEAVVNKLSEMLLEIEEAPKVRKPIKISFTARQQRREERVILHRKKQQRLKNKNIKNED
jgi:ribosome-associated protein